MNIPSLSIMQWLLWGVCVVAVNPGCSWGGNINIFIFTWYYYRCLPDKNCYAYQYKEPGPGNCLLIHGDDDCIITGGQIFERDDSSVVYIKGIMCVLCCLKISEMYPSFTSFGSNGIPPFCAISSSLVCIA